MRYLFGDNDIALRRLELLARVYGDSTRRFIASCREAFESIPPLEKPPPTPSEDLPSVIDLGCGPGFTTRLLADTLNCRAAGLDNSESFVYEAKRRSPTRVRFWLHDVTRLPFPMGGVRLIHCRFLLTHLRNPVDLIRRWSSQLRPGGLLLVEEVETIDTTVSTFATYLEIVQEMLAEQGTELYIGPLLADLEPGSDLSVKKSQVSTLQVSNCNAADLFSMNLQTWKQSPFIQEHYSTVVVKLEQELSELRCSLPDLTEIRWDLRQLVLSKSTSKTPPGDRSQSDGEAS